GVEVGLNQKAFGNLRHVRKTCRRIRAKVEYTPGSGPLEGTAGRVSIIRHGTALKLRKATEYPVDTKDESDLCQIGPQ
ncbi:hypothetical protein, partial [Pseudomonas sp.]|uniref:hypothetical protein n=1 Tax=Pseudomonas sp. TaxID=306 RepID=UPI002357084D